LTPVSLGIDLGTTNCALAWARADQPVQLFDIPQLVNAGEERARPLLPSFLFLPGPSDFPPGTVPDRFAGALAQRRGAENPGRLVASAKSWLCFGGVNRESALLPVEAPEGVPKLSPVAASAHYLEHLRAAWLASHEEPEQVLITVPASFDAVARELTEHAAQQAGFANAILLEEPQAAFYAWIERHPDWRERVRPGHTILVVDIGGGTTDFTLIAVRDRLGELELERVAVGDHILLGGDNIDLALAHVVEQKLGQPLDRAQKQSLWQHCRLGKEALLAEGNTDAAYPITLLGGGSKLIGGALKTQLLRADIDELLREGFLPLVAADERPARRRAGLAETGLPYAPDAAITRHLAAFLAQANARPTHVLFNGGVLRAPVVRERIVAALQAWQNHPVEVLDGEDLMHAVARGAAYYGLARQGRGVRIRGGVPKTYYIGVESAMPAVPGVRPPVKALAVAPFGIEEGSSVALPEREFSLYVGEPAEFRFFQSGARKSDAAGDLIDDFRQELTELAPIVVTLDGAPGETVRVTLEARVTETGQLQLFCVARDGRRWKLEFNVREKINS
jgi:molecular chaperone DnaK (HSP70)